MLSHIQSTLPPYDPPTTTSTTVTSRTNSHLPPLSRPAPAPPPQGLEHLHAAQVLANFQQYPIRASAQAIANANATASANANASLATAGLSNPTAPYYHHHAAYTPAGDQRRPSFQLEQGTPMPRSGNSSIPVSAYEARAHAYTHGQQQPSLSAGVQMHAQTPLAPHDIGSIPVSSVNANVAAIDVKDPLLQDMTAHSRDLAETLLPILRTEEGGEGTDYDLNNCQGVKGIGGSMMPSNRGGISKGERQIEREKTREEVARDAYKWNGAKAWRGDMGEVSPVQLEQARSIRVDGNGSGNGMWKEEGSGTRAVGQTSPASGSGEERIMTTISPNGDANANAGANVKQEKEGFKTTFQFVVNEDAKEARNTVRKHVMREYRRRERWEQGQRAPPPEATKAQAAAGTKKRRRKAQSDSPRENAEQPPQQPLPAQPIYQTHPQQQSIQGKRLFESPPTAILDVQQTQQYQSQHQQQRRPSLPYTAHDASYPHPPPPPHDSSSPFSHSSSSGGGPLSVSSISSSSAAAAAPMNPSSKKKKKKESSSSKAVPPVFAESKQMQLWGAVSTSYDKAIEELERDTHKVVPYREDPWAAVAVEKIDPFSRLEVDNWQNGNGKGRMKGLGGIGPSTASLLHHCKFEVFFLLSFPLGDSWRRMDDKRGRRS